MAAIPETTVHLLSADRLAELELAESDAITARAALAAAEQDLQRSRVKSDKLAGALEQARLDAEKFEQFAKDREHDASVAHEEAAALRRRNARQRQSIRQLGDELGKAHETAAMWHEALERVEKDLTRVIDSRDQARNDRDYDRARADELNARLQVLAPARAVMDAVDTIKQTGGAVEIAGVRIEPCDEYGTTDTTRLVDQAAARVAELEYAMKAGPAVLEGALSRIYEHLRESAEAAQIAGLTRTVDALIDQAEADAELIDRLAKERDQARADSAELRDRVRNTAQITIDGPYHARTVFIEHGNDRMLCILREHHNRQPDGDDFDVPTFTYKMPEQRIENASNVIVR